MQTSLYDHSGIETSLSEIDWSFKGAETDYLTHGIYRYPARMVPQIPRHLFNFWTRTGILEPGDTVFDPFSGSGTTATEARLHGLNAVATDINPFACLLSRTKAKPGNLDAIEAAIHKALGADWIYRERFIDQEHDSAIERHPTKGGEDVYPSDQGNSNHDAYSVKKGWFPERQLAKIEEMQRQLTEMRGEFGYKPIRFLRIALSQTARKISYQRDGEFKRHRIPEEERPDHDPPFTETYLEVLTDNFDRAIAYTERVDPTTKATISHADCRNEDLLEPNSVDAIVTSPPYGDSQTTVAYGQFSQDPAAVATPIDVEDMKNVDPAGLGGRDSVAAVEFETVCSWSPTLEKTVGVLEAEGGRDEDVLEFFTDYAESLLQMSRVIKNGQPVALVVGNRTVSRVPIPMHQITAEIARQAGLSQQHSFPRSIPSKTIPFANAPENTPGEQGETIADEYVLIFEAGH
jgi:site-specific DNA-methyltransferase (cytosine-N4-specific)